MPLSCSKKVRYRFRDTSTGKQRLGFCGKEVIEVVGYKPDDGVKKVYTRILGKKR